MKVQLDTDVTDRLPRLSLGILHYSGASVGDSPKMLKGRINYFVESLRLEHDPSRLTEIEGIREWRAAFKQIGTDPSRYRPSSEALLRRLLQGNPFFWINSAVDVNNFFSVLHALPFGIYDQDQLTGDVVLRIGQKDDCYEGLNGREVNMEDKLLLADDDGAFGSPIVDSRRSCVTDKSRNLMQVIFFHEQVSPQKKDEIVGSVGRMFTDINGGEVSSSYILGS
ncbi:B3/4 domain-containing protein [Brevibacillus sp. GCM10020057]|uniref:B3/B4 domain-containing protein n=1 Tax=Brevibacillus sp. GCM10020057 TaxID=3317327 RepID=UPI003635C4D1